MSKWGLTMEDATALHWLEVPDLSKMSPELPSARAIMMPYADPLDITKPLLTHKATPFMRFRLLPHPLAAEGASNGLPKYLQPPGTGVEAYYPCNMDWDMVRNDRDLDIIITEGEAKAAKACKEGFPTIGLGGVDSFRSLRRGIFLCGSLESFPLAGRKVVIAYDSDITTNKNVMRACNALAEELAKHGAFPHVVFIPPADEKEGKAGLDDYLIRYGWEELDKLLQTASPLTAVRALYSLNDRYVVIKDTACIYDLTNQRLTSRNNLVTVTEAALRSVKLTVTPNGTVTAEPCSAAAEWLKWPMRSEVDGIAYEPGQGMVVDNRLNVWPGWGCEPEEGDVGKFLGLLDYMFRDNLDDRHWFVQWLAYPIQHPGVKMYTAAVLFSLHHGTGKSFLGQIIGKIYGQNYAEVKRDDLSASFNAWAENKQFILGDEITGSDKRAESDGLKRLITAESIRINKKYLEEFVLRDCINYLFTTNHPDAFFMEDGDRRFFIHEIQGAPLPDTFYDELHDWVYNENGAAKVMHYLQHYDLTGFNPRARARQTMAKVMMFEDSLGDLAGWVRALLRDPDQRLAMSGKRMTRDIYSSTELLRLYDPGHMTRVTSNGMTRELRRAGVPLACNGVYIPLNTGRDRMYILRNKQKWLTANLQQVTQHCLDNSVTSLEKF